MKSRRRSRRRSKRSRRKKRRSRRRRSSRSRRRFGYSPCIINGKSTYCYDSEGTKEVSPRDLTRYRLIQSKNPEKNPEENQISTRDRLLNPFRKVALYMKPSKKVFIKVMPYTRPKLPSPFISNAKRLIIDKSTLSPMMFGYSHNQGPKMFNVHYDDGILLADNAFGPQWGNPEVRAENADSG
jgi:hypothetical protein